MMMLPAALNQVCSDHAELKELIGRLRQAIQDGHFELSKSLLHALHAIEAQHYANEEALMQAVDYIHADSHRAQHAELLCCLENINRTIALENLRAISPEVAEHLDSAITHMVEADRKLNQFAETTLSSVTPEGQPRRAVGRETASCTDAPPSCG